MSQSQQPTSIMINPTTTHLMNQFAHRFIHALNNVNRKTTTRHYYYDHMMHQRSRRVKIAAYTAMASVVGSRRAWSRALLWKIRNRSRNRPGFLLRNRKSRIIVNKNSNSHHHHHHAKVSRVKILRNPNYPKTKNIDPLRNPGQEWMKLRKLVPGAETMDLWCLMGETADYIRCLAAQVHVMKTLVARYTAT